MTKVIIKIFLFWRVSLFFLAFIGSKLLPFGNKFPYSEELLIKSGLPEFLWTFANFDGVHYLTIAKMGYQAQFTQVFFPLYPILIHLLNPGNLIFSGLLISNLAFLLSLIILHKLLAIDYKTDKIKWVFIFLLLFPTSFYFVSLYTESLFFLFVLCSFYFARKNNWIFSGVFGFLASLTRFFGIFLLPALLIDWYLQKKPAKNLLPLLLIPVGLLIYMYYLKINFNDPLYFIHAQPVFGAQRTSGEIILFPQVVFRYIKILLTVNPQSLAFFNATLELIISLLFFVLSIIALFKTRLSYAFFSFCAYILPTLTGTFSSMPRYVLILFPAFLILANIKSKSLKIFIALIFAMFLIISTLLFTRGYWIA